PGRRDHGLDALAVDLLGHRTTTLADVTGRGRSQISLAEGRVGAARGHASQDADCARRLFRRLQPEPREHAPETLFHELEMPLVPVLARMERAGIRIEVPFFRTMGRRFARELETIQDEVHALAGGPFNLNSTPQLREVLFERLGLPVLKRTKTGPS